MCDHNPPAGNLHDRSDNNPLMRLVAISRNTQVYGTQWFVSHRHASTAKLASVLCKEHGMVFVSESEVRNARVDVIVVDGDRENDLDAAIHYMLANTHVDRRDKLTKRQRRRLAARHRRKIRS